VNVGINEKFITESCVNLFKVTSTIEETLDYIENYNQESVSVEDVKLK
jgi:hypothetical protein